MISRRSRFRLVAVLAVLCVLAGGPPLVAQNVTSAERRSGETVTLTLANDLVQCSVVLGGDRLLGDMLSARSEWSGKFGRRPDTIRTDADFSAEIMWTDWQAPGTVNNAENPVRFTKKDFRCVRHGFADAEGGAKEIELFFKGAEFPLLARVRYRLDGGSFYVRRDLALADSSGGGHFLQEIWPRAGNLVGDHRVIKRGGFGQPIGFRTGDGGGFIGVEYPAADNIVDTACGNLRIRCGQEIGEKIGKSWLAGAWVVEGMSPDPFIKLWFGKYVDAIRVAPLRPYTLYNSWYDLRSPDFPKLPKENVMNEENISRIISLLRKNMIEKHGIKLDAFVLDDGWDVYASDWKLRSGQFPRGLKPIADELSKTQTSLGIWLGPTGGYSFRDRRISWMKQHGYEVVGDQMCVAGSRYSALLTRRTTDFVSDDGVGFFKWDGIQFSCSEPDHGHPVGINSRRAVMEAVIGMCRAVRAKNPATYLNITSGTWLSPWWVQYANQIWMQGGDYGYADVPSISPRDAAITYRDLGLFDDFRTQDFWFPIQNLMTHGIIKGNLQKLGGEQEPLDKFTNEVLLYFARGVSMWELYISPDILSDGEWDAMAQAIQWAKDRFPILSTTEMVGGDPSKRECYGYVHFKGTDGIIAARNPWIEAGRLKVGLSAALGLDPEAASLVLERVYPDRWISAQLHRAGDSIEIPLDGYETALYEVYPLAKADVPLLAGVTFDAVVPGPGTYNMKIFDVDPEARLMNPAAVRGAASANRKVNISEFLLTAGMKPARLAQRLATLEAADNGTGLIARFELESSVTGGMMAILLTPEAGTQIPNQPLVQVSMDGKDLSVGSEKQEGKSQWYTVPVSPGGHTAHIGVRPRKAGEVWLGHASVWLVYRNKTAGTDLSLDVNSRGASRPMPPRPWPAGEVQRNVKVGDSSITTAGSQ